MASFLEKPGVSSLLANVGATLLQGAQWHDPRQPPNYMAGIGNAMNSFQQAQQFAMQKKMQEAQLAEAERKRKAEASQAALFNNAIRNLPADKQALLMSMPASARGQAAMEMLKPQKKYDEFDIPKYDANVGKWYQENKKTNRREYISPPTGMSVEVGPDGTMKLVQGAGVGGMTNTTKSKIEGKQFDTGERLTRLQDLQSKYRPEYQQVGEKFSQYVTAIREKVSDVPFLNKLVGEASQEEKTALAEYTKYRQSAFNDLAQILKEMSGGAVTPSEATRQLKVISDPGEGLLSGDSPTEFKAKLDEQVSWQRRAIVRYLRAKRLGLSSQSELQDYFAQNPIEKVPTLQQRGDYWYSILKDNDKVLLKLRQEGYIT